MKTELANLIAKELSTYSREVGEKVDKIANTVVDEAVRELKTTSPKRHGKYARNWRFKKNSKGSYVVYNAAPTYRLTHLLEKGHILKNGGRSKAIPHIKPVEEHAIESFEKGIEGIGR